MTCDIVRLFDIKKLTSPLFMTNDMTPSLKVCDQNHAHPIYLEMLDDMLITSTLSMKIHWSRSQQTPASKFS